MQSIVRVEEYQNEVVAGIVQTFSAADGTSAAAAGWHHLNHLTLFERAFSDADSTWCGGGGSHRGSGGGGIA